LPKLTQPNGFVIVPRTRKLSRLLQGKRRPPPPNPSNRPTGQPPSSEYRLVKTVIASAKFPPILADQSGLEWTPRGSDSSDEARRRSGTRFGYATRRRAISYSHPLNPTQPPRSSSASGSQKSRWPDGQTKPCWRWRMTHLRTPGLNPLAARTDCPVFRACISIPSTALLQSGLIDDG